MANSVYKVVEVVGTSNESISKAISRAISKAGVREAGDERRPVSQSSSPITVAPRRSSRERTPDPTYMMKKPARAKHST